MRVLHEDNHLLAVAKPAGLATMGALAGKPTLVEQAKAYLKRKYHKPGAVYLGVVSRLDAPVTGVVVFARTSKAAARLTAAFRERRVEKLYAAVVSADAPEAEPAVVHYLKKDDARRRVFATIESAAGAQRAELGFRCAARSSDASLLLVRPVTGRKHQIRAQLAKLALPLLGDEKYGSRADWPEGVALHAWRLRLEHPVRREPIEIAAPLPSGFTRRFAAAEAALAAAADAP